MHMGVIVPELWAKELHYSLETDILRCILNTVQCVRMDYSIQAMSLIICMVMDTYITLVHRLHGGQKPVWNI